MRELDILEKYLILNGYKYRQTLRHRINLGGHAGMNIYTLATLFAGIMIGANFGFIIASFMRANDNEDMLDK